MASINVDGQTFEVSEGENLLHACLSHGLDLPYFCWHPAMGSVGACRQCAVVAYQDEDDTRGRLTMACMTPASDGARISIVAESAEAFRASVVEWLMENHPHDCPVCEEGGECHLQDMTVMTGHTTRRYRGQKRTWENQYLGPFINHEMNRCITCYRCVRFYRDYAGGTDLEAFGSRSRMYFGRAAPGVLDSEFAGNLVEVCPTGVFTDKPFSATYTRKWDLQSAPSVCTGCSMGCNTFASERYGALKRVHNRYHNDINRYFICDRGRFGMSYVNSDDRIRVTGERIGESSFRQIAPVDASARAALAVNAGRVVGIGSPRASVEDNHALRTLVGDDNYCAGFSAAEAALMARVRELSTRRAPTLGDVEQADAVLILGEDLMNTAPRLGLAIRQAGRNLPLAMADDAGIPRWQDSGVRGHAQHASSPVFIASVLPTRLDDAARATWRGVPDTLAGCGRAIADAVTTGDAVPADPFIAAAATALAEAARPLIVTGVSAGSGPLLDAAAQITANLERDGVTPELVICGAEGNSFGASLVNAGLTMGQALDRLTDGSADTLIVMQNDLYRRAPREAVDRALSAAGSIIVVDSMANPTAEAAHLVFPSATSVESTGTLVNYEFRAQRFYQVFAPGGDVQPGWRWIADIAKVAGDNRIDWRHADDVLTDCERQPGWAGLSAVSPPASHRGRAEQRVPRETHRYSGRTAMYADATMHEPKTQVDAETPFSYSMEGSITQQPGALAPYVWAPGWNSNQAIFKFQQEVGGPLAGGDPGVHLTPGVAPAPQHTDQAPGSGDGLLAVPVPVLFGSEELSAASPAIRERMPFPFVVLNPDDARTLGVDAGDGVTCLGSTLEVRIDAALTAGHAAVCTGMPGAPSWLPAGLVALARDTEFVRRPTIIARG